MGQEEISSENRKSGTMFPIFRKNYKPRTNPLTSIAAAIQKSTPPRKRRSLLGKKETPGLVQMVLDAGQKDLGPRLCGECGLLYSPGDIEDEEEHRKAHTRLENLHTITLWKDPNIVQNFVDGTFIVIVKKQGASKPIINKLENFLEWIDSELSVFTDPELTNHTQQMYFYMYPKKRKNAVRILGYAAIELIDKNEAVAHRISEPDDTAFVPGIPLTVGITRLWTDKMFRKKQIATRLIDTVRFNTGIPGYVVPKDKLGILEPSEDGRAFMRKYSDSLGYAYTK